MHIKVNKLNPVVVALRVKMWFGQTFNVFCLFISKNSDITLCKNVDYLPECLQIQIIIKSIYTMLTIKVFHKNFGESSLLRAFINFIVNI